MGFLRLSYLRQRLMNYVFYLHAAAGTLDASTAPFVLTAATAKLGILIEFLFGWLLNLAALTPIAPAAGFDVCF